MNIMSLEEESVHVWDNLLWYGHSPFSRSGNWLLRFLYHGGFRLNGLLFIFVVKASDEYVKTEKYESSIVVLF